MPNLLLIFMILFSTCLGWSQSNEKKQDEDGTIFSGRISRLNGPAKLARIRTDFANIKFLNRKDRVEFWNETYPERRCLALIEGRTNDYFLIRIPQYDTCIRKVHFTSGTYLHFESPDLENSIKIAKELIEILLKKERKVIPQRNQSKKKWKQRLR